MPSVLIVDDEPAILQCLQEVLQAPEISVLTATTAADGLEAAARLKPDVVILDLELPDFSGLELLQRLHQLDARIPAILITGRGTAATAIQAMTLGAFDYLLKPPDLELLRALVARAIEA